MRGLLVERNRVATLLAMCIYIYVYLRDCRRAGEERHKRVAGGIGRELIRYEAGLCALLNEAEPVYVCVCVRWGLFEF